jgi:hypothetical protein
MIRYYDEGVCGPSQMFEDPDGEWCRREDVERVACTPAERAVLDACAAMPFTCGVNRFSMDWCNDVIRAEWARRAGQ